MFTEQTKLASICKITITSTYKSFDVLKVVIVLVIRTSLSKQRIIYFNTENHHYTSNLL